MRAQLSLLVLYTPMNIHDCKVLLMRYSVSAHLIYPGVLVVRFITREMKSPVFVVLQLKPVQPESGTINSSEFDHHSGGHKIDSTLSKLLKDEFHTHVNDSIVF
jgi:hypothetical protein